MAKRRKLIEVSLPLTEISAACKADKDRKTGTIKNVHKWFAPMPTPAWRALLFAALVDDPGGVEAREELIALVRGLVSKDGGGADPKALAKAQALIEEATGGDPPVVFDPFCGGGSTLVEAQRLGLPAAGSDLNPVPLLISRTLCELIPQVAGRPPLVPDPDRLDVAGDGPLGGFLTDCRHYAQRVRDIVWDQVGHLYPAPPGGGTVIAWLWARTVVCPNPACRAIAPLVSSFWLSKRKGALTWVEPTDLHPGQPVRFEVRTGDGGPPSSGTIVSRSAARCLTCKEPMPLTYVRAEGKAGRMSTQLMAAAVDTPEGRRYLAPVPDVEPPTLDRPEGVPEVAIPEEALGFRVQLYGMTTYADLFTNRQLVALGAFADAVKGVPTWVAADGGDELYTKAVATVLGLCVSKLAMANSTQVRWLLREVGSKATPAFSRHALPMVWDFAETNPFAQSVGSWLGQLDAVTTGLRTLPLAASPARTFQADARVAASRLETKALVATDPPYFAQIGYADLSDYFYVWLRRALKEVHPDLFRTVATPKADELIAAPYRHGGDKDEATKYFVEGFTEAFHRLLEISAPDLPILVVYAHRQEESDGDGGVTSTGWEAMLRAILAAGLQVVRTWPIWGSHSSKQIGLGTNALATYMVLACRPREETAGITDRRGFLEALHAELPETLRELRQGNIAPVDLAQAAIGPGMEVFSRYTKVVEPSGEPMPVRTALGLINQVLDEVLTEQEGEFDADTRFAIKWFEQFGFEEADYDPAEGLARAMNVSVKGLEKVGILVAQAGRVKLLRRQEMPAGWDPATDSRLPVWEVTQHLVKALDEGGAQRAAELVTKVGGLGETARDLAYRLYAVCERRGWAEDGLWFNALVTSWPEIVRRASARPAEAAVAQRFAL